jgi:PPK2 family polyphosphate:nucleotide phosphotransferase
MKIKAADFQLRPGKTVKLDRTPTFISPLYQDKEDYKDLLEDNAKELDGLQRLLYSSGQHALLLIFQGMDASGKDGIIRSVMNRVDPQGCMVHSFKKPSLEEWKHDFLWRTHMRLPERGRIGIFNRAYYEEVLVTRVKPEILRHQGIDPAKADKAFWQGRFRSIVDSESHLHREGTRILKFFLHISEEEQRKRFLARIDEPEKHWKFEIGDIEERARWDKYMRAYEACLAGTSTAIAPWHVIPADDKKNARLIVSALIIEALRKLKLSWPVPTPGRLKDLKKYRKLLAK